VPTLGCSREVLDAVSHVIQVVLEMESDRSAHTEELDKWERRLKFAQQTTSAESPETLSTPHYIRLAELHRLSGLIYLQRAGRQASSSNVALQEYLEKAFEILWSLDTCERMFPLFIVGCEASADTQRTKVLELISRTEEQCVSADMLRVRHFIERFWAQYDLDMDQSRDYIARMTTAVSIYDGLPVFS
jgi:hypothetical protein